MRASQTQRRDSTESSPAAQGRLVTVPNLLSILRLASVPVFVWLFVDGHEIAAVCVYGTAAFTDFVDGYVARALGQVTELGKLLDPLADRIFVVALAVALVLHGTLFWGLAVAVVGRDAIVLAAFPLLERWGVRRIPVNFTGKTATALLLFGLSWLTLSASGIDWAPRLLGLVAVVAGAVAYWAAGAQYLVEVRRRLATAASKTREETPPR